MLHLNKSKYLIEVTYNDINHYATTTNPDLRAGEALQIKGLVNVGNVYDMEFKRYALNDFFYLKKDVMLEVLDD